MEIIRDTHYTGRLDYFHCSGRQDQWIHQALKKYASFARYKKLRINVHAEPNRPVLAKFHQVLQTTSTVSRSILSRIVLTD